MKKPLKLTILTAAMTATTANAALVAHYGFEGNANDSQGSFNGTENGSISYVAGKFGQAVSLDSGVDFIQTATNNFGITTGNFTMSLWVQRNGDVLSDPAFFSNKNWNSGLNRGINFAFNGDETFNINTQGGPTGTRQDFSGSTNGGSLANTTWTNIILVRSGTTLTYYVNGVAAPVTRTIIATADFTGLHNYVFGDDGTSNYNDAAGTGQSWANPLLLDDIAIYDNALSQTEITALQNGTAIPEPSSTALLGLAGLALLLRRHK